MIRSLPCWKPVPLASADLTTISSSQKWELVTLLSIFCPARPTLSEHVVSGLNFKVVLGLLLGCRCGGKHHAAGTPWGLFWKGAYNPENVYCRKN